MDDAKPDSVPKSLSDGEAPPSLRCYGGQAAVPPAKNQVGAVRFWRRVRTGIWLIGICVYIAWLGWLPYKESRLAGALPAGMTAITVHEHLGGRWHEIASSPLAVMAAGMFDLDLKDVEGSSKDSGTIQLLKMFAGRKTIFAWYPTPGNPDETWLAFSSWAGFNGQLLRWGLLRPLLKDFRQINVGHGYPVWVQEEDGKYISLTIIDGYFIGTYSRGTSDVLDLMRRIEDKETPVPEVSDVLAAEWKMERGRDRGWFSWKGWPGSRSGRNEIRINLNADSKGKLIANAKCNFGDTVRDGAQNPAVRKELGRMVCDDLDVAMILPTEVVREFMQWRGAPKWCQSADLLLGETENKGITFLGMLGKEYSGRILGLRVPALLAGATAKRDLGPESVSNLVDRINLLYGVGLVPVEQKTNGLPIIVLSGTTDGVYGSLQKQETPAIFHRENWMFFCSSREAIPAGLANANLSGKESSLPRWSREIGKGDTDGIVYVDFAAAEYGLRDALAAAQLMLSFSSKSENQRVISTLASVREGLPGFARMGEMVVLIDFTREGMNLRCSIGRGGE